MQDARSSQDPLLSRHFLSSHPVCRVTEHACPGYPAFSPNLLEKNKVPIRKLVSELFHRAETGSWGALTDRTMPLSPRFAAPSIWEVLSTFLNKLIASQIQASDAYPAPQSLQLPGQVMVDAPVLAAVPFSQPRSPSFQGSHHPTNAPGTPLGHKLGPMRRYSYSFRACYLLIFSQITQQPTLLLTFPIQKPDRVQQWVGISEESSCRAPQACFALSLHKILRSHSSWGLQPPGNVVFP